MFIGPYINEIKNKNAALISEKDKKSIQIGMQVGVAYLSARLGRGFKINSVANTLFEKSYHFFHHTQKFHYTYKDFTKSKLEEAFESEFYQFKSLVKQPFERLLWGNNLVKDKEKRFQEIISKLPTTSPYKIAQADHLKKFSKAFYQFQFGFDKTVKTGIAAFAAGLSTGLDYFIIGKSQREAKRELIKTIHKQYQIVDEKIKNKHENLKPKINEIDSTACPEKLKKYQHKISLLKKRADFLLLLDQKIKTHIPSPETEKKRLLNEYKINFIKEGLVLSGSEFISFHFLKEAAFCCHQALKREIAEVVADSSLDYIANPFLHNCFKDPSLDSEENTILSKELPTRKKISTCKNAKHIKQEEIDQDLNELLLSILKLTRL